MNLPYIVIPVEEAKSVMAKMLSSVSFFISAFSIFGTFDLKKLNTIITIC
jgi:hypothetical protein